MISIDPQMVEEIVDSIVEPLVGDMPVSMQISEALEGMASKDEVRTMRIDLEKLKKDMEKLLTLVGDLSVSEQIDMAINRSEN